MAFRDPRPELRALGTRRGLRLLAVAAWSSFFGAALILVAGITVLPAPGAALGWHELSLGFLLAWALCLLPVGFALTLAQPHTEDSRGR